MEISPQIQNQLVQFEQVRQQIQAVTSQRIQMDSGLREINGALEELEKASKETPIYKNAGSLMIKVDDLEELKKDLKESQESLEVRINSLKKQEEQLKSRYESLQESVQKAMADLQGS